MSLDVCDRSGGRRPTARLPRGEESWGWEFRLEDFVIDRLDEDAAAATTVPEQNQRRVREAVVAALRSTAIGHSIYVDREGYNTARCATCSPVHGVPCVTMRGLAALWAHYPDHPYPDLTGRVLRDEELFDAGTYRRLRWPHTL